MRRGPRVDCCLGLKPPLRYRDNYCDSPIRDRELDCGGKSDLIPSSQAMLLDFGATGSQRDVVVLEAVSRYTCITLMRLALRLRKPSSGSRSERPCEPGHLDQRLTLELHRLAMAKQNDEGTIGAAFESASQE
jgi:hypothetical protein